MDENPYQTPIEPGSKPAFRTIRSGLGWQIIGLLLYTFSILPCCMSLPLLFSGYSLSTADHPDVIGAAIYSASAGLVFGIVGGVMLLAGYKIRRSRVAESDDESATRS